ncbi:SAGA complex deubiquitinating submodule subunit, TREX complex subunit Sus1 [Schizosaccharomyces osmophilus]|uniref:Transcription and mRNA export factor SUS1 n=1 Tax=Schizosaccharomyces osmophilus TaxID=2545709 RepID=A0AAE9WBJ5_9SCHI|nr:SAGA complex deubiquitinating submodule subunit, TREX complex subunit Sus1 [Schizosaccharomyces osmophilus]WBW72609.1 SAGA complex deubiquitinating submodule subunit, TREX complex subunit Sus1 [Schizosaccharomyces osmophilus]
MTAERISEQLHENGDYERLANELEYKLETCGWASQLRDYTRGIARGNTGIDFKNLYEITLNTATESIPDTVKMGMIKDIKSSVLKLASPNEATENQKT